MPKVKNKVRLCMGSSCFARGNKNIRFRIEEILETKGCGGRVDFSGSHCLGYCHLGPNITINEKTLHHISSHNIESIIINELGNFDE